MEAGDLIECRIITYIYIHTYSYMKNYSAIDCECIKIVPNIHFQVQLTIQQVFTKYIDSVLQYGYFLYFDIDCCVGTILVIFQGFPINCWAQ